VYRPGASRAPFQAAGTRHAARRIAQRTHRGAADADGHIRSPPQQLAREDRQLIDPATRIALLDPDLAPGGAAEIHHRALEQAAGPIAGQRRPRDAQHADAPGTRLCEQREGPRGRGASKQGRARQFASSNRSVTLVASSRQRPRLAPIVQLAWRRLIRSPDRHAA
jgi:hypothetical protein